MPQRHPTITLIDVWMGPWPPWVDAWLLSCQWNPSITWLIFCEKPPRTRFAAPNVKFITITWSTLLTRVSRVLGQPVTIRNAHKICDCRPLFGEIFREELTGSDFWGWADNDQFWGNIRAFLTDERLDGCDVVSAMRCCLSGPCTLFRNSAFTRDLWRSIPDFHDEFASTPRSANLCETGMMAAILPHIRQGRLRPWMRHIHLTELTSETWDRWSHQLEDRDPHDDIPYQGWPAGQAVWHRGRVFEAATGAEFLFFHFRIWKGAWRGQPRFYVDTKAETMLCNPAGIWCSRAGRHRLVQMRAMVNAAGKLLGGNRQAILRLRTLKGIATKPPEALNNAAFTPKAVVMTEHPRQE